MSIFSRLMGSNWQVKGSGQTAFVAVNCDVCQCQFTFPIPNLHSSWDHCNRRERIPENIYERFCDARDSAKRRVPERPELFKFRWL